MLAVSPLFCLRVIVFFIVFVLFRVCPMLSVSLLFCLRFIVILLSSSDEDNKITINLRQNRKDTDNIGHTRHRTKTINKTINLRQNRRDTDNIGHTHCLRPVSCVPNVVSVPSVLSKVYCFFHCLRPVSCVPNLVSVPSVLSKVYCFFHRHRTKKKKKQ
jgi:hypothetical protein